MPTHNLVNNSPNVAKSSFVEFSSAIFIPGSSEKMLAKAAGLNADLVLFDLEDSVSPANKANARKLVANIISSSKAEFASKDMRVGVRINDLSSAHILSDIEAILPSQPDLIMLPKVECGEDLVKVDAMLRSIEAKSDLELASTKIFVLAAETPASLFLFGSLTDVSDRLVAMTWGPEDLASELGAVSARDQSGNWLPPLQLAQTFCLAKACDLSIQAVDTVYADIRDLDGLRQECMTAKQMGFTGKLAIHPSQLEVINDVFSPSEQEIEQAQRLVDLFATNPDSGALQLDGKMVDIPHLRLAERLLKRLKK